MLIQAHIPDWCHKVCSLLPFLHKPFLPYILSAIAYSCCAHWPPTSGILACGCQPACFRRDQTGEAPHQLCSEDGSVEVNIHPKHRETCFIGGSRPRVWPDGPPSGAPVCCRTCALQAATAHAGWEWVRSRATRLVLLPPAECYLIFSLLIFFLLSRQIIKNLLDSHVEHLQAQHTIKMF